jgi:hypothetical protein
MAHFSTSLANPASFRRRFPYSSMAITWIFGYILDGYIWIYPMFRQLMWKGNSNNHRPIANEIHYDHYALIESGIAKYRFPNI